MPVWIPAEQLQECTLYVEAAALVPYVVPGSKGDPWEEQRSASVSVETLAGSSDAEEQGSRQHCLQPFGGRTDKYTYIALWLDALYLKMETGEWVKTKKGHHVTIAYLPWVNCRSRWQLHTSKKEMIYDWLAGMEDPLQRPHDLMPWRNCITWEIEEPSEEVITQAIYELPAKEINARLDEGRIRMCQPRMEADPENPGGTKETATDVDIVHFWHRDTHRLHVAQVLEEKSASHVGLREMIHLELKKGHVTEQSEMLTLLHYAKERLIHRHQAQYLEPRRDVGILQSWHVTPQEDEESPNQVQVVWVTDQNLVGLLEKKSAK